MQTSLTWRLRWISVALVLLVLALSSVLMMGRTSALSDPGLDPAAIARDSGIKGSLSDGVFKIEIKRPELGTAVEGIKLTPEFGLSGWITLSGTRDHALLLGDLPLRQEEVAPILRAILKQGLSATSLHNRFTMDSSRIMSLHFEGSGNEQLMARAMGWVYSAINGLKSTPPRAKPVTLDISRSTLDQKTMESLLWKGKISNGIFRVELPRGAKLKNQEVGHLAAATSWAAFAGDSKAVVVNGDIASLENELPFVLRDLLEGNIQIASIHTHMTQEKPRLVFVHFFGVGPLETIAPAVKEAIWEKEHFQSQ